MEWKGQSLPHAACRNPVSTEHKPWLDTPRKWEADTLVVAVLTSERWSLCRGSYKRQRRSLCNDEGVSSTRCDSQKSGCARARAPCSEKQVCWPRGDTRNTSIRGVWLPRGDPSSTRIAAAATLVSDGQVGKGRADCTAATRTCSFPSGCPGTRVSAVLATFFRVCLLRMSYGSARHKTNINKSLKTKP